MFRCYRDVIVGPLQLVSYPSIQVFVLCRIKLDTKGKTLCI
ncbi:unnamed protein product [Brassica oleracea]